MLFPLWGGESHRPTRDLDLHGRGESGVAYLEEEFRALPGNRSELPGMGHPKEMARDRE